MKVCRLALLGLLICVPALAQEPTAQRLDDANADHKLIETERKQSNAVFDGQERECESVFAVNACVHGVKMRRIAKMAELKRRETALNDVQRHENAQQKRQRSEAIAAERADREAGLRGSNDSDFTEKQEQQRQKILRREQQATPLQPIAPPERPMNKLSNEEVEVNRLAHAQKLQQAQKRQLERDARLNKAPSVRALPVSPP